jgi:hypothetical protein
MRRLGAAAFVVLASLLFATPGVSRARPDVVSRTGDGFDRGAAGAGAGTARPAWCCS